LWLCEHVNRAEITCWANRKVAATIRAVATSSTSELHRRLRSHWAIVTRKASLGYGGQTDDVTEKARSTDAKKTTKEKYKEKEPQSAENKMTYHGVGNDEPARQ
jgi:hypothetical protein